MFKNSKNCFYISNFRLKKDRSIYLKGLNNTYKIKESQKFLDNIKPELSAKEKNINQEK